MIVLDTNVLSELVRRDPDQNVRGWLDSVDSSEVATTAVTVAELQYGVARLPAGRRRERLSEAVHGLIYEDLGQRVEPFDLTAAEHYAVLVSQRESAGRPISVANAQIAAICIKLRATLATRNIADFEISEVDLIDPWQQS